MQLSLQPCFSFSSVQFSCSVMSDSLWPDGLQHTRLPCPSPTFRAYSNSCPLSWWCYLTISSSATPFSFCLQSFPASESFPMNQLFTSGGQNIGAWASASVPPVNEYSGLVSFRIDWFDLLATQGTLKSPPALQFKSINSLALSFLYGPTLTSNSHIRTWPLKKP